MKSLTYRLDQFEGPLDLLLTLIQKNKFDIADIPISVICDQYMEYITAAESHDLDVSSDFIVMASRLMVIKSKMLLPRLDPEEEDPRADLAAAVLEYARAKEASMLFAGMYSLHSGRMIKDTDEIEPDHTLKPHSPELLYAAMQRVLAETKTVEASATRFTPLIRKRSASAAEKAFAVIRILCRRETVSASELFRAQESRSDMIAVFLAILELLKNQRIEFSDGMGDEGTRRAEDLTLKLIRNHRRNAEENENE